MDDDLRYPYRRDRRNFSCARVHTGIIRTGTLRATALYYEA
jgi:hypothetical protein